MDDFIDSPSGHPEPLSEAVLGESERLEKVLSEDLAGVNRSESLARHGV
jgi:hypothetical protein